MTSASTSPEVRARSREAGAIAFIAKPIDETVLLEHLSSFAGLTWIYKKPGDVGDELVFPPDEEMQVLRHLARVGNMRLLRERAEQLQAMDARYAAFAARISRQVSSREPSGRSWRMPAPEPPTSPLLLRQGPRKGDVLCEAAHRLIR
jgi:hypothetical protein